MKTVECSVTFRVPEWSYKISEEWKEKLELGGEEVQEYARLEDEEILVTWTWDYEIDE